MGEMADYYLDLAWDAPLDEHTGESVEDWNSYWSRKKPAKPSGPGACPRCGAKTRIRMNSFTGQAFYGCTKFPECKGSRDGD